MSGYEESYMGQIRQLVGKREIIITAARAVIHEQEGRVLFIRRRDNGLWAMPAGSRCGADGREGQLGRTAHRP